MQVILNVLTLLLAVAEGIAFMLWCRRLDRDAFEASYKALSADQRARELEGRVDNAAAALDIDARDIRAVSARMNELEKAVSGMEAAEESEREAREEMLRFRAGVHSILNYSGGAPEDKA